ncbi:dethiobiotin synthase [Heliobacterium chlorum]|uniref:ATP-dependent dethiobiotin synthetase BioD n=1 Tax=Heliobacterium chlorum TaxID=2698 RepID=A0ABR7SYX8_HELCL|nr:dethiobiotin synthase [Heliobacterium chlorum]MBC9783631.1 dethiobiotin synthase [Heliobacterium chlorum]
MATGIFITGTDTGVGKTVVTAALTKVFTDGGIPTVPCKPIQTGAAKVEGDWYREDVAVYRQFASLPWTDDELCPLCYEYPLAPAQAAELEERPVDLAEVQRAYRRLAKRQPLVLVEGAGGLAVPVSGPEFTMADLAVQLQIPAIIVARAGLGTINHTVLTARYAHEKGLPLLGIIFNELSETPTLAEETSPAMIARMTGLPILACLPRIDSSMGLAENRESLCRELAEQLDFLKLLKEAKQWQR